MHTSADPYGQGTGGAQVGRWVSWRTVPTLEAGVLATVA